MPDAANEEHRPGDRAPDSEGDAAEVEGQPSGAGAESYGGDTDAGPGLTKEELERGLKRDQAEG